MEELELYRDLAQIQIDRLHKYIESSVMESSNGNINGLKLEENCISTNASLKVVNDISQHIKLAKKVILLFFYFSIKGKRC